MKITGIALHKCNIPFSFPFHSPQTLRVKTDSILLTLHFENGVSGFGESAPRWYVTGETSETVTHLIQHHFAQILLNSEIKSIEDIEAVLQALETSCQSHSITTYQSALGAVDLALFDAFAKLTQKPLHEFLYPVISESVPLSISIPLIPLNIIHELREFLDLIPYQSIKILLSDDLNDSVERVHLIRSLVGDNIQIRIEANGKWSREHAITCINSLKKFNISAVEQPVAQEDLEGMIYVRKVTGIQIIADESLCSLDDAENLVKRKACDIFNIKISKCGGLLKSRRIAEFALSRDISCVVGSHVGETAILSNAGRYFAMTLRNIHCLEGFSHLLYRDEWTTSQKIKAPLHYFSGLTQKQAFPLHGVTHVFTLTQV